MAWDDKRMESSESKNRPLAFNPCLATDSYKVSHGALYPRGTTKVYSYFESRGNPSEWQNEVVFFGLQYLLSRLEGQIVTRLAIEEAREIWAAHFGNPDMFNVKGWTHILEKHGGRLPVSIRAVPEGSVVPTRNVLMTIENTDPACYWLTNWLETYLVQTWYPTTVATQSREMKRVIKGYLEKTGNPELIPFKLHDFGFRGVTSYEQAGLGGAAHLVNFQGTDTIAGVILARQFYGASMPGFSIPASEHSTITSWGEAAELAAFRNMLETYPTGLVACVSDSYDIIRACRDYWGKELKAMILGRQGTLVVRPDSGNPPEIVVRVLDELGAAFGFTTNNQGYKVLPDQVRVIQGDGIDFTTLEEVLSNMTAHGWSADNVAFGSGGGLLQKLNRDTLRFAFKCSYIEGEDFSRGVHKNPVTDTGKASKSGRLRLVKPSGGYQTVNAESYEALQHEDCLKEVYRNGDILVTHTFDDIRARAAI